MIVVAQGKGVGKREEKAAAGSPGAAETGWLYATGHSQMTADHRSLFTHPLQKGPRVGLDDPVSALGFQATGSDDNPPRTGHTLLYSPAHQPLRPRHRLGRAYPRSLPNQRPKPDVGPP